MSVKAKLGGFATLIVAAVVVLGAGLVKLPVRQDKDPTREVAVAGIWSPSPRHPDGVQIIVWSGGVLVDKGVWVAPYTYRIPNAKVGSRVEIRITMRGEGITTLVGCSIAVNGVVLLTESAKNVTSGFRLICWMTVV